jgi:uncharacterized membrane protein YccC
MANNLISRRGVLGGMLAAIVLVFAVWSKWPVPQLNQTDAGVFKTVDALFTALTSRDRTRLNDCERRLKSHRADGRMSESAASALDSIIREARDGEWEPAAKRLYNFMLVQQGKQAVISVPK